MRTPSLALAALVALAGTAAAQARPKVTPIAPGTRAPDFELTTWDGTTTYKLSSFRATADQPGRVVVVDFWCAKCPGSRKYEAALSALARRYTPKGVQFIAVDANGVSTTDELRDYITANRVALPVVRDKNFATSDAFGALVTPHVFVIDTAGVVCYAGAIDNRRPADDPAHVPHLANALDAVLGGAEVPVATTRPFG